LTTVRRVVLLVPGEPTRWEMKRMPRHLAARKRLSLF
jgi:hypothetical protein